MDAYLFIDFGSTYTKLTLIDIEKEEIIATEKAYTTVETDVTIGYKEALERLNEKIEPNINIIKRLACSSAAGGLKIIAIGLVPELTAEAAKRAALGAGARVIKTYSHNLNTEEILQIKNSNADIILLAGGTDGGNTQCISHNAWMLEKHEVTIPIVIAGNKSCNDEIIAILEGKVEYYITENVMPNLNKINVEPAREVIRTIFMKQIVDAKGMEHVEESISGILMPTPASVLKAAQMLSMGSRDEDGIGDLIVIDIGGATTDIHSIGEGAPTSSGVMMRGLEEPFSKRTVEGDLGMRYSALAVLEAAGARMMKNYISLQDYNLEDEFKRRYENTSFVSKEEKDILFDEAMAKVCVDIEIKRHVGVIESVYTPMGMMHAQEGKDLTELPFVIGTGGILVNSSNPLVILSASLFKVNEPTSLKPKHPKYLIDKNYILSAMGLLAMIDENMSVRMLKKYMIEAGGNKNVD